MSTVQVLRNNKATCSYWWMDDRWMATVRMVQRFSLTDSIDSTGTSTSTVRVLIANTRNVPVIVPYRYIENKVTIIGLNVWSIVRVPYRYEYLIPNVLTSITGIGR